MTANFADSKVLVLRCLNSIHRRHKPTYVAARYLADSLASDPNSLWTHLSITRKFPLQNEPHFFALKSFKKKKENNENEYRNLLIPSPLTCLAETLVLSELSTMASFAKPKSVYSHQWPKNADYRHNFLFYFNGYRQRNVDIKKALISNPECLALVVDIKNFYPSIDHQLVRERFQSRWNGDSFDSPLRKTAFQIFEHLLVPFATDKKGIAVGPDVSNVVGDIALAEIDKEFDTRFPDKYFRYVDDIVLIIKPEEKKDALILLERLVANEGLQINHEKTDFVSSENWRKHCPEYNTGFYKGSFGHLITCLKIFLAVHPQRYDSLQSALLNHGFIFPLSRLRQSANNSAFRNWLNIYLKRGWKTLWDSVNYSEENLVELSQSVRENIHKRLSLIFEQEAPLDITRRRWHIQRVRYLVNRALYLFDVSELSFVYDGILAIPEFAETVALIEMLRTRDCSNLLKFSGPVIAASASLLQTAGQKVSFASLSKNTDEASLYSLAIFALYGVVDLSSSDVSMLNSDLREYLMFCSGEIAQKRDRNDFGYIDEIRTLQMEQTPGSRIEILETKFVDEEDSIFEALEIGGEYLS